jgi:hypothetical protein
MRRDEQDGIAFACFKEILNQLNLFYIYICLYFKSILNFIFAIVFYAMRLIKQDLSYIYFEEFLNQLNLIYFYICLYL